MKKSIVIFALILCFVNCATKKEEKTVNLTNNITVIKFMYLHDYPMAISMKSFWDYPEELAQFKLPLGKETILDEIQVLPIKDCNKFDFYNYAFIVNQKEKKSDTIYADTSLKTWVFKRNGKTECRYDEKGLYAEFLRQNYPFFKDCW